MEKKDRLGRRRIGQKKKERLGRSRIGYGKEG